MAEAAVVAIAGLAYAISYASLYTLAQNHNFGGPAHWESIAWPFSVDLSSLATGIIALDRAHRGKSAWLAGIISAVAAGLMVAGNILANAPEPAAWTPGVTVGMHAWIPAIALACWYMLVRARRDDAVDRGLLGDAEFGPDLREPSSRVQEAGRANEPASPPANVPANEPAHDLANEDANQPAQPEAPEVRTADEPSSQADSQPATVPAARQPAKPSAKVMRIAREGGDWRKVAALTGMSEHAAKRALTSARKLIAADSQAGSHGDSQDGAQPGANVEVVAGANEEFAA